MNGEDIGVRESALLDPSLPTTRGRQGAAISALLSADERAAVHDVVLALADMAERTGTAWSAEPELTFRGGGSEVPVVLFRGTDEDRPAYLSVDAFASPRGSGGPRLLASYGITDTIMTSLDGADDLASVVAESLGHPRVPPAGSCGPTATRMSEWYRGVMDRLTALGEENLRTRAIEPGEEAYHVAEGVYVTERQFSDVLPGPTLRNRFIMMSFGVGWDPDEASLRWSDWDYWSDAAADLAVAAGGEDGCYWTSCEWAEEDYPGQLSARTVLDDGSPSLGPVR